MLQKTYEEGTVRNILRGSDIEKVVSAFTNYKDIDRYCHIADFEEIKENEFNLNVPRYVDISEPEEEIDIQETITKLKKLENEKEELRKSLFENLNELGFDI